MDEQQLKMLLISLAQEIRDKELESLKFLCSPYIARSRLEEITEVTDLWIALQELERINPENLKFLEHILLAIRRQDLVNKIPEHMRQGDRKYQSDSQYEEALKSLEKEINFIVKEIGKDWKKLARQLEISEGDIDAIIEENPKNLKEQIRSALNEWVRQQVCEKKKPATRQHLIKGLKLCEKNFMAHRLNSL